MSTIMHTNRCKQTPLLIFIVIFIIAMTAQRLARSASIQKDGPDFTAARDEAAQILSGFIKVDTTNPPGNEPKGAQYLKGILDREGIASEIVELEAGRANLVERMNGSGKTTPLICMG